MGKRIVSKSLKNALLQLKFTEKEIATYIMLLEKGLSSVQDISRVTGVNRVSVYAAIDELKEKDLVFESRKGKKKLYGAEDPENLERIVMRKKEEARVEEKLLHNAILPVLRGIDINREEKPQVKIFEGADGITKVFDDYMLKGRDVINCGSYETATRVVSEKDELKYFRDIEERKIFYRMILEDTPLNRRFAQAARGVAHTKFLPAEIKISADVVIAGSVVALISYDQKTATVIEDASIAQAIKMQLDFMWDRL